MNPGINKLKILNDPVHGFIRIPFEFIYDLIEDPWFQRLRYIKQLGLTDMVYPGATHSRFVHSLGALHLMGQALNTLREKGVDINAEEYEAALIAILCHDLGHGPFSHSLEFNISGDISHEDISRLIMKDLDGSYKGRLSQAIAMFNSEYSRRFFSELISSQVDMDRLDYLLRDSYYTGVIEGSVGSDRIISMLNIADERLVIDEKGVYSIEKFLIARRFMYWQVYMHKTVLSADQMLKRIIGRARYLLEHGAKVESTDAVDYFLRTEISAEDLLNGGNKDFTNMFFNLDDNEMVASVRLWTQNDDTVLSDLAEAFLHRRLPAIELSDTPFESSVVEKIRRILKDKGDFRSDDIDTYIYTGCISNMTYAPQAPSIKILGRDGSLSELTEVSGILRHETLSKSAKKYFLSYPKDLRESINK